MTSSSLIKTSKTLLHVLLLSHISPILEVGSGFVWGFFAVVFCLFCFRSSVILSVYIHYFKCDPHFEMLIFLDDNFII